MEVYSGTIEGAQKTAIYGPEGIGKSSLAAKFPNALFEDTEGSTKKLNVRRTSKSAKTSSWTLLLEHVKAVKNNPSLCDTFVVDTGDWAEKLCKAHVCATAGKAGIEDFGYGKGYTYLEEEFGRLLNALSELIDLGINVVIVCHAQMRKFEQPDEMGSYDRWEMKLEKKVYPLVKEWADMVLFCNYKTYVVDVDGQGTSKGKNKVQGGKRVMYTTHHPCWDAKNRHDLPPELPMDYKEIAHCIVTRAGGSPATAPPAKPDPKPEPPKQETKSETKPEPKPETKPETTTMSLDEIPDTYQVPDVPKPLKDLMVANRVTVEEIQKAVASRGYYPIDTPIGNYDTEFINGVLVGAWPQVFGIIEKNRVPFK